MGTELTLGLWLSLMGIGVVAGVLSLLILSIQILKYFFHPEKQETSSEKVIPSEREPDDTGELLASAPPDEVLAIVAVERHRRQMSLGDRLRYNASHIYSGSENR